MKIQYKKKILQEIEQYLNDELKLDIKIKAGKRDYCLKGWCHPADITDTMWVNLNCDFEGFLCTEDSLIRDENGMRVCDLTDTVIHEAGHLMHVITDYTDYIKKSKEQDALQSMFNEYKKQNPNEDYRVINYMYNNLPCESIAYEKGTELFKGSISELNLFIKDLLNWLACK